MDVAIDGVLKLTPRFNIPVNLHKPIPFIQGFFNSIIDSITFIALPNDIPAILFIDVAIEVFVTYSDAPLLMFSMSIEMT